MNETYQQRDIVKEIVEGVAFVAGVSLENEKSLRRLARAIFEAAAWDAVTRVSQAKALLERNQFHSAMHALKGMIAP